MFARAYRDTWLGIMLLSIDGDPLFIIVTHVGKPVRWHASPYERVVAKHQGTQELCKLAKVSHDLKAAVHPVLGRHGEELVELIKELKLGGFKRASGLRLLLGFYERTVYNPADISNNYFLLRTAVRVKVRIGVRTPNKFLNPKYRSRLANTSEETVTWFELSETTALNTIWEKWTPLLRPDLRREAHVVLAWVQKGVKGRVVTRWSCRQWRIKDSTILDVQCIGQNQVW